MSRETTEYLARLACRAYHMSDPEIAALLMRMARSGETRLGSLDDEARDRIDVASLRPYFRYVLPELAARLLDGGSVEIMPRRPERLQGLSPEALRMEFIEFIQSVSFREMARNALPNEEGGIEDVDLALAQSVNGNIAVIALDRVAPPGQGDRLANTMRLTGAVRGTPCEDGMWHPDMALAMLAETGAQPSQPDECCEADPDEIMSGLEDAGTPVH